MELGTLEELGNLLLSLYSSLPPGTIILLGSLSQLRLGGLQAYTAACVKLGKKFGAKFGEAIQTAKVPEDVKTIRSFVGLCNFFRTHIKNFAIVAAREVVVPAGGGGARHWGGLYTFILFWGYYIHLVSTYSTIWSFYDPIWILVWSQEG